MADDIGKTQDPAWPLPKFSFAVDLGDELNRIHFQEVSGMDVESEVIEYRSGNSRQFSVQKLPGLVKYSNVTMKRGVIVSGNTLMDWFAQMNRFEITTKTIVIRLLDEGGKVVMQWVLQNAWPVKISFEDMKSDGSGITVDTLEVAYERLIRS